MSMKPVILACLAAVVLAGAAPGRAQDAKDRATAGPLSGSGALNDANDQAARPIHRTKTAHSKDTARTQDGAKPAKPKIVASKDKTVASKDLQPWAAVDPKRVAPEPVAGSPKAAPTTAGGAPDEDPVSVGMKWTSNNDPTFSAPTTSGLINEYNHTMGATAPGTDAELGVKLKF